MCFEETIIFLFLALCFLHKKSLAESLFIKFLINFAKYLVSTFFKISFYYFKLIFFLFSFYQAFFFTNFIPSFIQVILTFNYSFNYVWDAYLLLIIYTAVFWCLPYFFYKFYNEKMSKISVQIYVDVLIVFAFYFFYGFETSFCLLPNLLYFDFFIRNKHAFLSENDYSNQSQSLTQKSLKELAKYVRENYDQQVLNVKAKLR